MIHPAIGPGAKRLSPIVASTISMIAGVSEGVDVQRVDQMVDVKNVTPDVENFQNKREERNTAEHHVRQIAEQRADKKPHLCSVLAHLLFRARFDPVFEWSCGFRFIKNHERSLADFSIFLLLLIGLSRRWRRETGLVTGEGAGEGARFL